MTDDNSKDMSVVYDHRNMPLSFVRTGVDSDYLVENRYDASGNRVSKFVFTRSVTNGSAGAWTFANATHYTGVGNEIRENAGAVDAKVVVNMPQGLGRYGVSDSKSFEWYLKNHLGSTMLVYNTGTTSSVKAAYDYKAFGKRELLAQMNDRVTEELTGKELDEEVDLNYFGARYYDAELGMWISTDPMRQFASPYLYAGNGLNSVNGVDPDGNGLVGASAAGTITTAAIYTRLNGSGLSDAQVAGYSALGGAIAAGLGALDLTDASTAFLVGAISGATTELVVQYALTGKLPSTAEQWSDIAISAGLGGTGGAALKGVANSVFGKSTTCVNSASGVNLDGGIIKTSNSIMNVIDGVNAATYETLVVPPVSNAIDEISSDD